MNLFNAKVAVLGATGYIGRSLVFTLTKKGVNVTPVSRDIEKARHVFKKFGITPKTQTINYDTFLQSDFDIVINATGIGSPSKILSDPAAVFTVTEYMDRLIFTYLDTRSDVQVFNLSSGSIYGLTAGESISEDSLTTFSPDNFSPGEFYSVAKFTSEAKHRSRPDLNITDLRVFSFFSQFVDSGERFLMSEVTDCLESGTVLETSNMDIVRDYCNADLLIDIMSFLCGLGKENAAYDVISKKPVTKFELLDGLLADKGLKYRVTDDEKLSVTGIKSIYCSDGKRLRLLGYKPDMTSYDIILQELSNR